MSTITNTWSESKIRDIIRKLDEKTGLNGAELPIMFNVYGHTLGCYRYVEPKAFGFNRKFFNDPFTNEAEVIDVIRHEYAHYYVDVANLAHYVGHSSRETSHGDDWKWACKMVGADPTRCHDATRFVDKNWSIIEAKAAYDAVDVPQLDILAYLYKWQQVPEDFQIASRILEHIKKNKPNAYYEAGDEVLHPKRGFGVVDDAVPYGYWGQKVYVIFDDHTEGIFKTEELCKVSNGVVIPYSKKEYR